MKDKISSLQKKMENAKTEEERSYFEKKMRETERRNAVTSDVSQVAQVLDDTETIFDE